MAGPFPGRESVGPAGPSQRKVVESLLKIKNNDMAQLVTRYICIVVELLCYVDCTQSGYGMLVWYHLWKDKDTKNI